MDRKAIDAAADTLAAAWKSGKLADGLPAGCSPPTLAEALEIQEAVIARLNEPVVGWKVAIPPSGPWLAGAVLKPRHFKSGAKIPATLAPQRGIETEIAYRFTRDLPPRDTDYSREEIENAVTAMIGFEIVDSRFRDPKSAPMFDKTADLQSNGGFVEGPAITDWRKRDLINIEVTLKFNGEVKYQARGGHPGKDPLLPAIYLVNLRRTTKGIAAGQFATTGTYTGMLPAKPGDTISATFEGVGTVDFSFTA